MKQFAALLVAFFFPLALCAADVTFVSSDAELNAALASAEKRTIKSIAVAERFYQGSAKQTKDRIRGLMARTFELGDRAVFMYGASFNVGLAKELLDERQPLHCVMPVILGKYIESRDRNNPIQLCGSMGDTTEAGLQNQIRDMHRLAREHVGR